MVGRISQSILAVEFAVINSYFRVLSPDEYPTENLPHLPTKVSIPTPQRPLVRRSTVGSNTAGIEEAAGSCKVDVGVNTDDVVDSEEVAKLRERVAKLEEEAKLLQIEVAVLQKKDDMKMRLATISGDDAKILFYTGFLSYEHLMVCFNFLGLAVAALEYRDSAKFPDDRSNKGRPRSLSPIDEFFMVLVRLRLGLLEQDVAYRFGISQPTVSRIFAIWINFLYLQFQQTPLWPPKELIDAYMPNSFKQQYPSTRVIIDATEVFIQQPSLPELQQRTFSSYKNHNTYKRLVGWCISIWCQHSCQTSIRAVSPTKSSHTRVVYSICYSLVIQLWQTEGLISWRTLHHLE